MKQSYLAAVGIGNQQHASRRISPLVGWFLASLGPAPGVVSTSMTTLGLQILPSKPMRTLPFTGRGFITALHDRLQKEGGRCHGAATASAITTEVRCTSREETMEMVDAFVASLVSSDPGIKVVVTDVVPHPLTPEQEALANINLAPAKLTLKFLQSLPAGYYIASNALVGPGTPAYADFVAPVESRTDQWKQIGAAGAAQKKCDVFRSKVEFDLWATAMAEFFASQRGSA